MTSPISSLDMDRKLFCRNSSRALFDPQAAKAAAEDATAEAFRNVLRFNFRGESMDFFMLI
jgi:hypothetical protein